MNNKPPLALIDEPMIQRTYSEHGNLNCSISRIELLGLDCVRLTQKWEQHLKLPYMVGGRCSIDQRLHRIKKVLIVGIVHLGSNRLRSYCVAINSILDSQLCSPYKYDCLSGGYSRCVHSSLGNTNAHRDRRDDNNATTAIEVW
jgi:hypothetical protein